MNSIHNTPFNFAHIFSDIGYYFHIINVVLSFVSVLMNTFHIFILSQKSMRTSSTNVILISLSVCDIAGGLTTIYKHFLMVDAENSEWWVRVLSTDFLKNLEIQCDFNFPVENIF